MMRTLLSRIVTLLIVAATGAGCGGGDGGTGPGTPVLTTVQVTPATATLFTVAPGNTATLAVVAKDQDGQTMAGAGTPTFSSDNDAVAGVSGDGTVTAVAAGTAVITASLTSGGVTKEGSTAVTVQVALASVGVTTPTLAFNPSTVDVRAGGGVTWTFGSTPHTVTFTTGGAPADVSQLQDGSASRSFPTNGSFSYHCSIHPQMTGIVRVH
jgi:plastocyanin